MEKKAPQQSIQDALSLDGDPANIKRYYGQWAESYDADMRVEYRAARYIAQLADEFMQQGDGPDLADRTNVQIADMGCGTGLVGQAMSELGYRTIDGMDISPEMVGQATKRGCYRALFGDIDLNKVLPNQWAGTYHLTLCCGVFTLGHVAPEALYELAGMTRAGGLIVVSTRTAYYESSDYKGVSDRIQAEKLLRLKHSVMDAPYTEDSDAHYWVYQVNS